MKKTLLIITIVFLLLILTAQAFPETERERLYRLAGVKTKEQMAIDELTMKVDRISTLTEKLTSDIDKLRDEMLLMERKLYYLEFKNK